MGPNRCCAAPRCGRPARMAYPPEVRPRCCGPTSVDPTYFPLSPCTRTTATPENPKSFDSTLKKAGSAATGRRKLPASTYPTPLMLFEFDRPVGVVEELLPAGVAIASNPQANDRVTSRLYRLSHQYHARLGGRTPTFSRVAGHAAANKVAPTAAPPLASGHHVIKT